MISAFPNRVSAVLLPVVALTAVLSGAAPQLVIAQAPAAPVSASATDNRPDRYAEVIARLTAAIEYELSDKKLLALSIALVDDQQTVWQAGFGFADQQRSRRATADTVYRVGSVSKLFTDLAIMQLVEQQKLDLDAPVSQYLPDFKPVNSFDRPITLRQLMSHRSGLVRESPVGSYFDPLEPSLANSVASLNSTRLVYPPETRSKYSNAGIATVGRVLEVTQQEPFAKYIERTILRPMGLDHSSFVLDEAVRANLSTALMWTIDGREFPAPTFSLGTAPAGNLYSTVGDQARFLSVLFAGGRGKNGQIVSPETLAEMWRPQFVAAGENTGFGLGFHVKQFEGQRRIGHGGAVYGFATEVAALPDAKLGAVVVTNVDVANPIVRRLSDYALRWMLAVRAGKPLVDYPRSTAVSDETAQTISGQYREGDQIIEVVARPGRLLAPIGDALADVRQDDSGLLFDGRLLQGTRLKFGDDGSLEIAGRLFQRVTDAGAPAPPPEHWRGLIGEYGWDHNTLYITERHGRLWALIEWFFWYPLTEISQNEFAFPDSGLYDGERLIFERDGEGEATQVAAASVVFKRRPVGEIAKGVFRIQPRRPIDDIRREAQNAEPPMERGEFRAADLVELTSVDNTLRLDIRYAGTNNFLGVPFYEQNRAFLQRPAAEALARVQASLKPRGLGLLVFDGYRPWQVTKMFWDATPDSMRIFVADPAKGSRHNRGCAVDLTLCDLATGEPVDMTGGYDEFSSRSFPDYPGGTSRQRWHRELLRAAMEAEGFAVYEFEWWHFDYRDWREYPILNIPFEKLAPSGTNR